MSLRKRILASALAAALALAVAAGPVAAQMSGPDQKFLEGLERRGLLRLLEQFLEDQGKSSDDPAAIKEQQARLFEMQGTRAGAEAERDELFGKAKKKYRELLDDLDQRVKATADPRAQDELRMRALNLKVRLGEMVWQREATNQLTNLELTDRQAGDREKVQRLLREATTLFQEVNKEASDWSKVMETDVNRYIATGLFDQAEQIKEYSLYQTAWTSYYLAYALPADDKDREKLLKEAIERFQIFTAREDDFQAKWESFKGVGMCNRELGKFDTAVENLRKALADSATEPFKISVYYELAQTYLQAKKFVEARKALDELRSKKYPKMEETFIGAQLMPFLDAKIALAEGETDPRKKEEGLKQMRQLWDRGQFWRLLVGPEVSRYIDKTPDSSKLQPFELWILADEAYAKKDYAEAVKYFEQYVKITPPTDLSHAQGKYNLAACYYTLSEKARGEERQKLLKMAANAFLDIASRFTDFAFADKAADAYVTAASQMFEDNPTDENLEFYATSLKWSLDHRPKAAEQSDMRWLYALVLEKQKKYRAAADQYAKVTTNSPHYYDALYQSPFCYRLDLLAVQWQSASATDLKRIAGATVSKMEEYVNTVQAVREPDQELGKKLRENAARMLIMAGEILAQELIQEYQRGFNLIERCEKEYADQTHLIGQILKVKVDCLVGQGRLTDAQKLLKRLIEANPEGLQDILQSLFVAITDEVGRLVEQNRMAEARKKVAVADDIGKMFCDYLVSVSSKDAAKQIVTIRYQLAELHLKAREFEGSTGAIERFKALIGFDPYDKRDFTEISLGYLTGLARSTMLLGQDSLGTDPAKAYENLRRSALYWENVTLGHQNEIDPESQKRFWEAKYDQMQVYYDLHDLEQKFGEEGKKIDYHEAIRQFLISYVATGSKFGGPAMKIQFGRLAQKLGVAFR